MVPFTQEEWDYYHKREWPCFTPIDLRESMDRIRRDELMKNLEYRKALRVQQMLDTEQNLPEPYKSLWRRILEGR